MTFAERCKIQRKALKLTQAELAERIGVSLRQVQKWESGLDKPKSDKADRIAKALNKDVSWVIGTDDSSLAEKVSATLDAVMTKVKDTLGIEDAERMSIRDVRELLRERTNVLTTTLKKMVRYENLPMPLQGVANADMGEGRTYDADSQEAGRLMAADADDPRLIAVKGDSAENLARDGQVVMVDTSFTNVAVGEPCIVLTRDGHLRLKRKAKDSNGCRSYDSINPDYPAFQIPAREVVAEFPVCGVFLKPRNLDTLETVLEVAPAKRATKRAQNKRARPKK